MGFLKKLGSSVKRLFSTRAEQPEVRKGVLPKQGSSVTQDTPVDDWRKGLDADDFRRVGHGGTGWDLRTVDLAEWHDLTSSNVRRIRWGADDEILEVQFHSGAIYRFYDVEAAVYNGYLTTHSPGQFHWQVIRGYGYRYEKIGDSAASAPDAPRFDGKPFAIPQDIQDVQAKAGRKPVEGGMWNHGQPKSQGVEPPPGAVKLPWK